MKSPILILHGWGLTGSRYEKIEKLFKSAGYRVYAPTMPGFGVERLAKEVMRVDDYVDWIVEYIKRNKLKKVILIGHSFGGRVGAKFAIRHPELIEKLILTGSPLIKRPLSLKKKIVFRISKGGKRIISFAPFAEPIVRKLLYRSIGEWDYYKSGALKETFKAVINEDLSDILIKIAVPTLIVWGEKDTFVPLKDGKEITEKINSAKLVIIPDASHKLPYEKPDEFVKAVFPLL